MTRMYDCQRSAVTFEPGDLVLVDSHALRVLMKGTSLGYSPGAG